MSPVPFFDQRSIIDSFKARLLTDREIEQHLADLMLVFDFSSSLNQAIGIKEIANLILFTLMGYTSSRCGVFLLRKEKGLELIESKGYRAKFDSKEFNSVMKPPYQDFYLCGEERSPEWNELCERLGVQLIVPLLEEDRLLGIVGIGGKSPAADYTPHKLQIAVSLVQMCRSAILSAQTQQTLESLNRQLILKVYQLNTLFELSKDFNAVWDSGSIFRILGSSLIGQLLISRCAVFIQIKDTLLPNYMRGFRFGENDIKMLQQYDFKSLFHLKNSPIVCKELESESLKDFLLSNKVHLIFPMFLNEEMRGFILLGDKKNRKPFTQEDYDFITTLGNLALVSDENARMQQEMIEKQRMERELAIARQIQIGLLPRSTPEIDDYEISSFFEPCYTVGGDYFDFLPVSENELALAIGDVSGKSTPAALIMACVQASLRTLARMQITDPQITLQRINQLLCESQSNKYVTFFYAVLDHQNNLLRYVNAGHCYPMIFKKDGRIDRLETGGTVMGFFPEITYNSASYQLDPGDTMLLYTDGVSELIDPFEEEFGLERICEILEKYRHNTAETIKEALLTGLQQHRKGQSQADDITFVLVKRKE